MLRENDIDGELVSELGLLNNLFILDMSYNDLSGTLPSELGLILPLKYLFFDSNNFSGTIPSELGQCKSLTILSIRDNTSLIGTVPSELCDDIYSILLIFKGTGVLCTCCSFCNGNDTICNT
jgi:hypothetical protein